MSGFGSNRQNRRAHEKSHSTAAAIASTVAAADQQTFTGTITDTTCGKSHGMVAGQPHEKCLAMCVIGPSGQYALFDAETVPKNLAIRSRPPNTQLSARN